MPIAYKLNRPFIGAEPDSVTKTSEDGSVAIVPFNAANSDYQKYQEWVALGNTPEPADEPEAP